MLAIPCAAFALVLARFASPLPERLALLWMPAAYALGVASSLPASRAVALLAVECLGMAVLFRSQQIPWGWAVFLAGVQACGIALAAASARVGRAGGGLQSPGGLASFLAIPAFPVNLACSFAYAHAFGTFAPHSPLAAVAPWFASQLPAYLCVMPLVAIWASGSPRNWSALLRDRAASLAAVAAATVLPAWYAPSAPLLLVPGLLAAMLLFDLRVVSLLVAAVLGLALRTPHPGYGLLAPEVSLSWLSACMLVGAASISRRRSEGERIVVELERKEACLEASGCACYRVTASGAMTWSHNAAEVLVAGEQPLPSTLDEWLLRIEEPLRTESCRRYRELLSGRPAPAREITLRHASGSQTVCEDIATPLRASADTWDVIGLVRNVTDLHAMREELTQARPVLSVGRIAGTIAHDLANVLSIIHGQGQLLAAEAQANSVRISAAIVASAERGRQLCRQILFIARPPALREEVHAGELVQELQGMLASLARPGVSIRTEVQQPGLAVCCNPGRLLQALLNLCINALEAMKDGGVLTLRCLQVRNEAPFPGVLGLVHVGTFVCFELSDTGEGIPPHLLSRIFEPGYSTKQGEAPRGLGLAIIASVLAEIGAFLDVESHAGASAASGTTFRIYVPSIAPAAQDARGNGLAPAKLGVGQSILVLDHDEEKLLRMEDMLASIGYEPKAFSSCEEAVESMKGRSAYRAAIVASNMTLADGTPFYEAVAGYMPSFRIVLVSQSSQSLPAAATSSLVEPFTYSDLGAVLARIVNT